MRIKVANNYILVDAAIYYIKQSIRKQNLKKKIHTIIHGNNSKTINKYTKFNILRANDDDLPN